MADQPPEHHYEPRLSPSDTTVTPACACGWQGRPMSNNIRRNQTDAWERAYLQWLAHARSVARPGQAP